MPVCSKNKDTGKNAKAGMQSCSTTVRLYGKGAWQLRGRISAWQKKGGQKKRKVFSVRRKVCRFVPAFVPVHS